MIFMLFIFHAADISIARDPYRSLAECQADIGRRQQGPGV